MNDTEEDMEPGTIVTIASICKKSGAYLLKHSLTNENIETILFKNSKFEFIVERDFEDISSISDDSGIKGLTFESICNFFKYPLIEDFIRKIYVPHQSFPLALLDITELYS